ncbi:hypothetical protein Q3A66_04250 [Hymenobacter sp. BT770]|uniref:DUF6134 family protein n=1 Tax=Hymenobacter sp. BT770 TaxID=2886942 RepID=UPI001D10B9EF|nr:DUF6134 family protein [Hymenobacter sp. BT770]MCC3153273.1 hypothetical protein [Hymenobacter sp. BT770]MDO3414268.1 hypothetical protein [Hymenobacter sp. BT770]
MSSKAAGPEAKRQIELDGSPVLRYTRPAVLRRLLAFGGLCLLPSVGQAQALKSAPLVETRRYAIEVAGLRVGTMTATRRPQAGTDVLYTLVSDVKVNFLLYHLKIYYQVSNRFRNGQLLLSTVEAHTNQGDFSSRTEWKGDHYDIVADQYKHHYRATETQPITYAVTNLFFGEPGGNRKAFAEYFGDYFSLSSPAAHTCRAQRDGREDEYQYANGQLVTIIKKNPLKNFIIRLLP